MAKKWSTHVAGVARVNNSGTSMYWGEIWIRETAKGWVEGETPGGWTKDSEPFQARWDKEPDEPGGAVSTYKEPGYGKRLSRAAAWQLMLNTIRPLTRDEMRDPLADAVDEAEREHDHAARELADAQESRDAAKRALARFDKAHPEAKDGVA